MQDINRRAQMLTRLSRSELEVLKLLCERHIYEEIAQLRFVSLSTVRFHVRNICVKLEIWELPREPRQRELGMFCPVLDYIPEEDLAPDESEEEDEVLSQRDLVRVLEIEPLAVVGGREVQPWNPTPPIPDIEEDRWLVPERRINPLVLVAAVALLSAMLGAGLVALIRPPERVIVREVVAQPTAATQQIASTVVAATATPSPVPTASATATPVPKPGTVLYQADWSNGAGGWALSKEWKTLNGMLLNDGSYQGNAIPPFQPAVADYAVEIEAQVVDVGCGANLYIFVRKGYVSGVDACSNEAVIGLTSGYGNEITKRSFSPGREWHSYRVEVKGNSIKLLIDGAVVLSADDNRYLEAGQVGLHGYNTQCNIRSFRIIAL